MTGTRYFSTAALMLSLFRAQSVGAAPRVATHNAPPPHQHSSGNHPPPHQHTSEHHTPTRSHTSPPHHSVTHQGPAPPQHPVHSSGHHTPPAHSHLTPPHSAATHQLVVGHQGSSPVHPLHPTHLPKIHHIVPPQPSGGGTLLNQLSIQGGGHTT